jgi:hypothetical protein
MQIHKPKLSNNYKLKNRNYNYKLLLKIKKKKNGMQKLMHFKDKLKN